MTKIKLHNERIVDSYRYQINDLNAEFDSKDKRRHKKRVKKNRHSKRRKYDD